jgi:predicted glutamine amidotransferase
MCLIIHQPEGAETPVELLRSAAEYNPDGFGFIAFHRNGRVRVERGGDAGIALASRLSSEFAGRNCAFHFRRRTRGSSHEENLHPFKLASGLYLMHNGTAQVELRIAGRSDNWLAPDNRLLFLDEQEGRIERLHESEGLNWRGLWLSNARWVERQLLSLDGHDGVARASQAAFC